MGPEQTQRIRAHAVVVGRVQGVGFRFSAVREAQRLGVRGWVRNRPDGTVEAEAEGERAAVEAFVRFLHRGPPGARVDDVALAWRPYGGELAGFDARHGG